MTIAVGCAVHLGVLRVVALQDPALTPRVLHVSTAPLDENALAPHRGHLRGADHRLAERIEASELVIANTARVELARAEQAVGRFDLVAVVGPRCPKVAALARRVERPRYALCADEHLIADSIALAAADISANVVQSSAAELLHLANDYFDLDRHALGQEAKAAQAALGADFHYHHRLPHLAARVALASTKRRATGET